jgi:ubiquinone/menaquinone biosynthesis C-methylase UbiE
MADPTQSFLEFERAGWRDASVCAYYDGHFSSITRQCIDALLDAAGVRQGSRMLDVATGAGYVAGAAADRGAEATGVDFSATQAQLARAAYPAIRFEQADAEALPFPAESFDAVVCNFGMCHFADPDAAVREAFRVLKRGGRMAFSVWDVPEKTIGIGAVYSAVRAHGSMDVGLPVGPNFFLFSDPEQSKRVLREAGFAAPSFTRVAQVWRVAVPDEVFDVIMHGTVRASATLRGQSPQASATIRAAVGSTISAYQRGDHYDVPMPAIVASGTKPL